MSFERPTGTPLFVASISSSNAAFLDGSTVPLAEYASAATTVPLDIDLWHRRLAHHHLAGVRMLLDKNLVTGMHLDSKSAPDPICEPCLAGKMHSNPFPSSQWRATKRADFDERYFPLSKRPTVASFPPPSAEVESTPFSTPAPVSRPFGLGH